MDLDAEITKRNADKLAREVARLVEMRIIDARSAASDAMLCYMQIGGPDQPSNVSKWCERFDKQEGGA